MKYQYKKNKGFTLIEMMVSIAVFSVVMVTAMGALLSVIDSNNKARSIKTAVNNISFALEGISKKMRMGTNYACGTDGQTAEQDCTGGVNTISFKVKDGEYIFYKFEDQIKSCISTIQGRCDADYSQLTSPEVILDKVRFYVIGVTHSEDSNIQNRTQPRMLITISGTAGSRDKTRTTFDLQTGISQAARIESIVAAPPPAVVGCNIPGDATNPACWSPAVVGKTWGLYGVVTDAHSETEGASNTANLVSLSESFPAAEYCDELISGGHDDWYLPAIGQLMAGLNEYARHYDQFSNSTWGGWQVPTSYWSSTDYWHMSFAESANYNINVSRSQDGRQFEAFKTRCLR